MATECRRVIALLACHNRLDLTLKCLAHLEQAAAAATIDIGAVLIDDGTDGTADAASSAYDWVVARRGSGDLYWTRAMYLAQSIALPINPDFLLWLNDDTLLATDAMTKLLATAAIHEQEIGRAAIIVGTATDPVTAVPCYGGRIRTGWLRRFRYRLVPPGKLYQPCETFNGNIALVPLAIARQLGNLDPAFDHALGDYDYGLRATKLGLPIVVAPGICGVCDPSRASSSLTESRLSLRERWAMLTAPKGLPPRSWALFTRRHGSWLWPLYFLWPYVRAIAMHVFRQAPGRAR